MFIFTLKSPLKSKKALCLLLVSFVVLSVLLVCVIVSSAKTPQKTSCDAFGEYTLVAKTSQDRADFLKQFGYSASEENCFVEKVMIPSTFNEVYSEYNELQLRQGLDLRDDKGKRADMYTYQIDSTFFTILVSEGCVIGGHKCCEENYNEYIAFYE